MKSECWLGPQGAKRHAASPARAADGEYRDCSCRGAERQAEWFACKDNPAHHQRALMPNPSFKQSTNGRPPGPGLWPTRHFHRPGPGGLPLAPA